jgi:hypothetical protein
MLALAKHANMVGEATASVAETNEDDIYLTEQTTWARIRRSRLRDQEHRDSARRV